MWNLVEYRGSIPRIAFFPFTPSFPLAPLRFHRTHPSGRPSLWTKIKLNKGLNRPYSTLEYKVNQRTSPTGKLKRLQWKDI
ncbi:hypothetical protein Lalb_Chr20g0113011 [Lupinus albus]|uniref:Uncharacterized protein n=1 Tax=Lupinus albus TaxID=3870 RepID=A0A6A4NPW9_LUPAL|nr:hypothetical protein Lalb_Chr20g0113011 [Lupinus albus]